MGKFISHDFRTFTGDEKTFLKAGEYIRCNQDYLFSPNGCWRLVTNGYHLFTFRDAPEVIIPSWSVKLKRHAHECYAIMQHDGNFCVYEGTGPDKQGDLLFSTNTAGKGKIAVMQWDGNFCIYNKNSRDYSNGCIVWQSNFNKGMVDHYEIHDIEYDYNKIVKYPADPMTGFSQTVSNDTDIDQSTEVTFEITYIEKHHWQTNTIGSITTKASVSGKIPLGAKIGVEISGTFTKESAQGSETSNVIKKKFTVPVKVPPHTKVNVTATIYNQTLELPYKYIGEFLIVDGTKSLCRLTGVFKVTNGFGLDVGFVSIKKDNDIDLASVKTINSLKFIEQLEDNTKWVAIDKNLIKEIK